MPDRDQEIAKDIASLSKSADRLEKFNRIHELLWKDVPLAGLPLPYRELISNLMNQTTLTVLTTIENIEILQDEAGLPIGRFQPSEQVVKFCKSMSSLSPGEGVIGSPQHTMWRVANGHPLLDDDYTNLKKISESLARSQTSTDKTTPFKTSWGQD